MNYYTDHFITVAKGMFGYYILLADSQGPIERLENWDYDSIEKCQIEAEKLAEAYNIRYLC